MPPLTDLLALLGIDLVLCAGCLRLLGGRRGADRWAGWIAAACFVLLWFPVRPAQLPVLAYIRGVSSDLSVTLIVLACLFSGQQLFGFPAVSRREKLALNGVVAAAAVILYPLALGWGDWDFYRTGWGSFGMWAALLAVSLLSWTRGLRLLPLCIGLSLLWWSAGLMESENLWDYLMDPWLAMAALFHCAKAGASLVSFRWRPAVSAAGDIAP